jgi:hypothetical protein
MRNLKWMLLTIVLFVVLSPGVLFTLPGPNVPVLSVGMTPLNSVVVHAIVFAVVYWMVRRAVKMLATPRGKAVAAKVVSTASTLGKTATQTVSSAVKTVSPKK